MEIILHQLYDYIIEKLKDTYSDQEAHSLANRLIEFYAEVSPANRILNSQKKIDERSVDSINEAIDKLLKNMPLQYVTGKAWFMDLELDVSGAVLIPRPETEELVNHINRYIGQPSQYKPLRILDIGTGSGCIAIALKHYNNDLSVTAIDISPEALEIAAKNALRLKTNIEFRQLNILTASEWKMLGEFDLIVSNPPYVALSEKQLMQPNVLEYEPHTALFVQDSDPLIFYRKIVAFSEVKLNTGGGLWFEINEMYANDIRNILLSQGFREVNIIFDFRGKSRFLQCFK